MTENENETSSIEDEVDIDVETYEGEPDETPKEIDDLQDDGRDAEVQADDVEIGEVLGGTLGEVDPTLPGGELGAQQEKSDA